MTETTITPTRLLTLSVALVVLLAMGAGLAAADTNETMEQTITGDENATVEEVQEESTEHVSEATETDTEVVTSPDAPDTTVDDPADDVLGDDFLGDDVAGDVLGDDLLDDSLDGILEDFELDVGMTL